MRELSCACIILSKLVVLLVLQYPLHYTLYNTCWQCSTKQTKLNTYIFLGSFVFKKTKTKFCTVCARLNTIRFYTLVNYHKQKYVVLYVVDDDIFLIIFSNIPWHRFSCENIQIHYNLFCHFENRNMKIDFHVTLVQVSRPYIICLYLAKSFRFGSVYQMPNSAKLLQTCTVYTITDAQKMHENTIRYYNIIFSPLQFEYFGPHHERKSASE